jgi:predicted nucleic acid-binding protein
VASCLRVFSSQSQIGITRICQIASLSNIRDLQQVWYTALPTWSVIDRAENLMNRFSLSHWDSMIIAACWEASVQTLYTEDFGYSSIDELKIVNPFKTL